MFLQCLVCRRNLTLFTVTTKNDQRTYLYLYEKLSVRNFVTYKLDSLVVYPTRDFIYCISVIPLALWT